MHEWALAEGVLDTALNVATERGMRRLDKIVVRIGQLQQIQKEVFAQSLEQVLPDDERVNAAAFELVEEAAALRCRACGHEFALGTALEKLDHDETEAIHFVPDLASAWIHCPQCDSPDFAVSRGRGVWIETIEGI